METFDGGADFPSTKLMTASDAIKELETNNEIIKNEFENYPNPKLCFLQKRNGELMHLIASALMLPLSVRKVTKPNLKKN